MHSPQPGHCRLQPRFPYPQAGSRPSSMGRAALDRALTNEPHLLRLLQQAHADLQAIIAGLAPHAPRNSEDPDLAFQVEILERAARELEFMLHPEAPYP